MKTKSFGFSLLTVISAFALSAVAFGTPASATDTATPSPSPVVSTDTGVSDEADLLALTNNESDVSENVQVGDSTTDEIQAEDTNEEAAFDDDVNAALLSGDNASADELKADAAIVTSIDTPEIAAIAADDTEAHNFILGISQK
jgi:hypothetical protein